MLCRYGAVEKRCDSADPLDAVVGFHCAAGRGSCPVAVLCGEKDGANLKASKELGARLPNAALQIVPGAGHAVNKDAPEAIAAALNGRT